MDINSILSQSDISNIISLLKEKSISIPSWDELKVDYDPQLHEIVHDNGGRRDKIHSNGTIDKAARLVFALEKLLCDRFNQFTFSIPVKRGYPNATTDVQKEIVASLEKIYASAHIDSENLKRGLAYYASCEACTLWYTKEEQNNLYGFESSHKLKCKTLSPMDGVGIYPLFDEHDDLIAMSFEYTKTVKDSDIQYFETFTADKHITWALEDKHSQWVEVSTYDDLPLGKIPCSYIFRPLPVFSGLTSLRNDIEYSISRNSDVIAYNSAPVLKITGNIMGEENKGETRRVYRVSEGGDVAYVSWQQSVEALKFHIDTLVKMFFMQSQMPDISFENMKSLGNIGYDARKTLLTDAHLKIGAESGAWIEFLERECNVVKAFLKQLKPEWEDEIDSLIVTHKITPFIQEDETEEIKKRMEANGGKPLESHLESIERFGRSKNAQYTLDQILEEERSSKETLDIFGDA